MRKVRYKPVVLDKGRRAGEVEKIQIPGRPGVFYKGYDSDGVPVIVAERDLEQMKNLVNLKIRPRGESVFTKTPDEKCEEKEFKRYLDKLGQLALKLEEFQRDDSSEYETLGKDYKSIEDPLLTETPDLKLNKRSRDSNEDTKEPTEIPQQDHAMPHEERQALQRATESQTEKESNENNYAHLSSEELTQPIPEPYPRNKTTQQLTPRELTSSKVQTLKFFICGTFTSTKRPILIIQPYEDSSLLGDKKSCLGKKESDGSLEVLMSGKFFNKNILEEQKGTPKYLMIENRRVVINSKTIIFEEGTHALNTNEVRIVIRGQFVKNKTGLVYTPFLFIGLERCSTCENNSRGPSEFSRNTLVSPTGAFFEHREIPTYTVEFGGIKSIPTCTERGETIYESPPLCAPRTEYSFEKSITNNVTVYKCSSRVKLKNPSVPKSLKTT